MTFPGYPVYCRSCHEAYVAVGMTDEAASRAANAGPTCCPPAPVPARRQPYTRSERVRLIAASIFLGLAVLGLLDLLGILG